VPPYTFSITVGSLPPGLTLNTSTGAITGTPTTYGTYNYTAQVVDSTNSSAGTTSVNCTIVVAPPPMTIQCASTNSEVGLAYNSSFVVTGGAAPYTFSIANGMLPPGLTLNTSTGAITGTPSSEGTFTFTITVTDSEGHTATGSCAITIKTCGSALTPITYQINETSKNVGQIIWFNSHLQKLQGSIPKSNFQIFITGGRISFGPTTLAVPDAVITFSSSANCASTSFNTTLNAWETTVPLSAASNASEIFASGLAYLIPWGFQGVDNVTWTADITSSVPGLSITWQASASNWAVSNQGVNFPVLSSKPFVPNYNGMDVNAAQGCSLCSGNSSDQAGAPEFSGRQDVLIGSNGQCGGSTNWTGTFACAPCTVCVCNPTGPGNGGSCLAGQLNASVKPGYNFAGIATNSVDLQVQGPISITGDLAVGQNGTFQLTNNAWLGSTLFADPSASIQIQSGSGLSGGVQPTSLSSLQAEANSLSTWAAGLKPTQTFSNINDTSSMTISGNGGQNVISVPGTFSLGNDSVFIVAGGTADTFIFNIPNGMQLGSGSILWLLGVPPGQVLFNVTGSTGITVDAAYTSGIFLAPNAEILVQNGTHNSEFISGTKLVLDCDNANITAPSCATQNGTLIVPYVQVCNAAWQQTNVITVSPGSQVNLGPQPLGSGSWSWAGPNGYSSTSRQINDIPLPYSTNVFVATYTNSNGMKTSLAFTINVN
jgi:choice-of-anchor A domain-containing protein